MARKKEKKPGYGKILDAWMAPQEAGDPIGCVATSFTFSPAFFEEECLSRFLRLESDAYEDGPAYLVEREEKMAQIICAAALVDQHYCRGSRSLRWDLLSARLRKGILHAKVSMLHWSGWTRLIVGSANLTPDGYRRNQEVFGVLDYKPGGETPLSCLREIVEFLREVGNYSEAGTDADSPALARWNALLDRVEATPPDWGKEDDELSRKSVRVYTVLTGPNKASVFDRLAEIWPGWSPPKQASVVSPFFDPPAEKNDPAENLWKSTLRKRGGAGACFFVSADEVQGEDTLFVHAPESLLAAQPKGRRDVYTRLYRLDLETNRPLHAKGIWLEDDKWALYMIGSSNFTSAGLGLSHANIEANFAYSVNADRNYKSYDSLYRSFPTGQLIKQNSDLKWQPRPIEGDDSPAEEIILPVAFGSAIYDCDDKQNAKITLKFISSPPKGWKLLNDHDDTVFYGENEWKNQGCSFEVVLSWGTPRPPSGFWAKWKASEGRAWLPVNIASTASLPPPQELKDLPLDVLINILTSSRPLHRVLQEYLKRKKQASHGAGGPPSPTDPHKRVDTSQFLLQRTRRVSWALNALRDRIERPVATEECLQWRLHGPVGVMALADALARERGSKEEQAFLLSELALELARATPRDMRGCMPVHRVKSELRTLILELKAQIPSDGLDDFGNLREYVDSVFESIVK